VFDLHQYTTLKQYTPQETFGCTKLAVSEKDGDSPIILTLKSFNCADGADMKNDAAWPHWTRSRPSPRTDALFGSNTFMRNGLPGIIHAISYALDRHLFCNRSKLSPLSVYEQCLNMLQQSVVAATISYGNSGHSRSAWRTKPLKHWHVRSAVVD